MTYAERLATELDAVFSGQPWHADALMPILEAMDGSQSTWRPGGAVHSSFELVEHLTFWKGVILARLSGDPVADADDRDWPIQSSGIAWSEAVDRLVAAHRALVTRIRSLTDADLDAIVPGKTIPTREMLHGAIYHDVYHAGQLRLLQRIHEEVA